MPPRIVQRCHKLRGADNPYARDKLLILFCLVYTSVTLLMRREHLLMHMILAEIKRIRHRSIQLHVAGSG